jgi:hypothetical protein
MAGYKLGGYEREELEKDIRELTCGSEQNGI